MLSRLVINMQISHNNSDYFFLFHPLLGRKSKKMSAHGTARPWTRPGTAFPASALTSIFLEFSWSCRKFGWKFSNKRRIFSENQDKTVNYCISAEFEKEKSTNSIEWKHGSKIHRLQPWSLYADLSAPADHVPSKLYWLELQMITPTDFLLWYRPLQ